MKTGDDTSTNAVEELRQRAKKLAASLAKDGQTGTRLHLVEFGLGGERYGVETRLVREVLPIRDLTPVPCTPRFVMGIINVRGQILPVIDLARFFGIRDSEISDLNKAVILRSGQTELAILADTIHGVQEVLENDLQTTLPALPGINRGYFEGVTSERLLVLNARAILHDRRMIVEDRETSQPAIP